MFKSARAKVQKRSKFKVELVGAVKDDMCEAMIASFKTRTTTKAADPEKDGDKEDKLPQQSARLEHNEKEGIYAVQPENEAVYSNFDSNDNDSENPRNQRFNTFALSC